MVMAFDSVFSPIISNFATKDNSLPRTILPSQTIHEQHDYWENWLSRSVDELAGKETKAYLKKIAPMLDKATPEAIAAVPWRVGSGVEELIYAGWREMWSVGSSDATRELNTLQQRVSKQRSRAEFAGEDSSTLEEKDPVSARTVKAKSNPFMVVYPPNYGMPLSRSVLSEAVIARGQAVARGYEGGVQSQVITSINKSIQRHRTDKGMPELAKKQLFDEIRYAVDPIGMRDYGNMERSKEKIDPETSKEISDRQFRASSAARRIASTELSAAYSMGRLNTYLQADVRKVRWVNLDRGACAICGDRNGMILNINELLAQGNNRFDASQFIIPAHPHCRCHFEPVDDNDNRDREDDKDPNLDPARAKVSPIAQAWTKSRALLGVGIGLGIQAGIRGGINAGIQAGVAAVQARRAEMLAARSRRAMLIKALTIGAGVTLGLGGLYLLLNEFSKEMKSRSSGEPQGSGIPGISDIGSNVAQGIESEALSKAVEYLREKETQSERASVAAKIPPMSSSVISLKLQEQPSFYRLATQNVNLNGVTDGQLQKVHGLTQWQVQTLRKEMKAFQQRMTAPLSQVAPAQRLLPDSLLRLYPELMQYPDVRQLSLDQLIGITGSREKGNALDDYIRRQLRAKLAIPERGEVEIGGLEVSQMGQSDWLGLLPAGSTNKESLAQSIVQLISRTPPKTKEELTEMLRSIKGVGPKTVDRIVKGGQLARININELIAVEGPTERAAKEISDRAGVSMAIARRIVEAHKDGEWEGMQVMRDRLAATGKDIGNPAFDALVRAFVEKVSETPKTESSISLPVKPILLDPRELSFLEPSKAVTVPQRTVQQIFESTLRSKIADPGTIVSNVSGLLGEAAIGAITPQSDLKRADISRMLPVKTRQALSAQQQVLTEVDQLKTDLQSRVFGSAVSVPGSRLNTRPAQTKANAAIKVARGQQAIAERLSRLANTTQDTVVELATKAEKIKASYAEALGSQTGDLVPVDVLSPAYQKDIARLSKEISDIDKQLKDSFVPDPRPGRGGIPESAASVRQREMEVKRDQLLAIRNGVVKEYSELINTPEVQGRVHRLKTQLGEAGSQLELPAFGLTSAELAKFTPEQQRAMNSQLGEVREQIRASGNNDFGIPSLDDVPLVQSINSQLAATEAAISRLARANQPDTLARLANSRDQLKAMLKDLQKLPKKKGDLSALQSKRYKQTFGDDKQRNVALQRISPPLENLRELAKSEGVRVNSNAETVLDKFRPRTDGTTLFQEELSGIERTATMGLSSAQKTVNDNLSLLSLVSGPEGADYVFRNMQRVIDTINDPEIIAGLGSAGKSAIGAESAAAFRRRIFESVRNKLEKEVVVNGVVTKVGAIPTLERVIDYDTKTRNLAPLLEKADTALAQEIANQQAGLKAFDDYAAKIEKGLEGVRRPDGTIQTTGLRDAHLNYYTEVAPEIRNEIKKKQATYLAKSSQTITELQEAKRLIEAEIAKPVSIGGVAKTTAELKENIAQARSATKASSLVSQDRNTVTSLAHRGLLTSVNQKSALGIINKHVSGGQLTSAEHEYIQRLTQGEIDVVVAAQRSGGLELFFARNKAIAEVNRLEGLRGKAWGKVLSKVEDIRVKTGFQVDVSVTEDTAAGLSFPSRITLSNPRYVDNPDRFRGGIPAAEARLGKPLAELRGILGIDEVDSPLNVSEKNYSGVRVLLGRRRTELESIELGLLQIGFSQSDRLSQFLVRKTLATFTIPHDSRASFTRIDQHVESKFTPSGRRLLPKLDRSRRYRRSDAEGRPKLGSKTRRLSR